MEHRTSLGARRSRLGPLGGNVMLKKLAFPLFLLFFMVPIPAVIYSAATFKLQILASQLADGALTVLSIPVLREGNVLELPNQKLSVVDACSGIRSLLSLTFLSLVYGYFFRAQNLAARSPVLFHHSHRHRCQRQPRHHYGHHDPGESGTRRRVFS